MADGERRAASHGGDRDRARDKLRAFYKIPAHGSSRTKPQNSSSLKQQIQPPAAAALGNAPLTPPAARRSSTHRPRRKPTAHKPNPLDIDTAAFDSKKYLKKLLLEKGVPGLLAADNELVSEIRQIDGDMKTMVYENYSKFISATETIRKMKDDADFMDAEMEKLTKRVNGISSRTNDVNAKFAERRETIQRLSNEHRLMKKLQFLFDLPDQLNKYISMGRFVDAARVWSRTQPLLEHYRQLGVFAGVEKDGKEIMASVEHTIWSRWRDPSTGVAEGAECASLLVLLRPERTGALWREYLDIQGVKNRNLRQAALEASYEYPMVCGSAAQTPAAELASIEPDPSGTPLPAVAVSMMPSMAGTVSNKHETTSRISYFNSHYLPVWSSLVIGFASQFVSPTGSGLLEQVPETPAKSADPARSSTQGRTMSLLEATTEGTVVGLLSPLAEDGATAVSGGVRGIQEAAAGLSKLRTESVGKKDQLVVGWQAMSGGELAEAQTRFSEQMKEWCSEYEFIVDSLIRFPDDVNENNVKPYLDQLDELVSCVSEHPILARIGGLHDCIYRVVTRWQEHLVEGALHVIVRDMLERLEYYFDPMVDTLDPNALSTVVSTPSQLSVGVGSNPGGTFGTIPRRSSVSRHHRNSSIKSANSQGDYVSHQHQRAASAVSSGWSGGVSIDRGAQQQYQQQQQQQRVIDASSPISRAGSPVPQSPLQIHTKPQSMRGGLAHTRAISSAYDTLNQPASASMAGPTSPSIPTFALSSNAQRVSRSSTFHLASARPMQGGMPSNRSVSLRKSRHQRTHSSAYADTMESLDDATKAMGDLSLGPSIQQLRRSFSLNRNGARRYKPWLISNVNRNAPLHVFLADIESWLIQQVLERVNPLLECVVQHYLDIEGSQILDEDEDDDEDDDDLSVSSAGEQANRSGNGDRRKSQLQLPVATRMRQAFIKTLDRSLDTWMSAWMPDAFIYSSMAIPVHGTRGHVEKTSLLSPMAQYGISIVSDPVASLLLARFAMDFELTLTQSIYQLCEQGISILPEDSSGTNVRRAGEAASVMGSADVSVSNLLGTKADSMGDPGAERMYSMTASVARADSMASMTSRRGTFVGHRVGGNMLKPRQSVHAAKWHSVAEKLVKHFVMTVGQDISSDYLKMRPYDGLPVLPLSPAMDDPQANRLSSYSVSMADQHSRDREARSSRPAQTLAVSEIWLIICRWLKQVEDDTNALFYDPIFSATLKAVETTNSNSEDGGGVNAVSGARGISSASPYAGYSLATDANTGGLRDAISLSQQQQQQQQSKVAISQTAAFGGPNALRLGVSGTGSTHSQTQAGGYDSLLHAHILSNIDRLFAERVDIFPRTISPLAAGKIMSHLAMQIVKAALEAIRLRPVVFDTAEEFHQVVADSAFIRSWALRYAGVTPNLAHASVVSSQQTGQMFSGEPRRRASRAAAGIPGAGPSQGGGASAATAAAANAGSASSSPVVNERDAQAIHNLIDDWVGSARACCVCDPTLPDPVLVDRAVANAWMVAYFGRDAVSAGGADPAASIDEGGPAAHESGTSS